MHSRSETRPTLIPLLVGPAPFALVLAAPLEGLSAPVHRLVAVLVWVVAYQGTEAIPLAATSLLGSVLCIVLGVAPAGTAGVSPIPPAIGAALGASLGFLLPVSTPPNAIVHGTGLVPLREMIWAEIWLDVAASVVIWTSLRVLCPLLGVM